MLYRTKILASVMSLALVGPVLAQSTAPSVQAPTNAPSTSGAPATNSAASMSTTDIFNTEVWAPTSWRASEAIGQTVYNRSNESIGEIEELLIDSSGRVKAAIVSVGGFLGMGERNVSVNYSAFEMTRDNDGKARLVVPNLNAANLKSAPEYKPMNAAKRM